MNNIIGTFEKEQIQKLTSNKRIPAFRSGDTVKVTLKIVEGERTRLQVFEGVCIARKNNGLNSNFTIRKISHGEGVEKVFPLFSSLIDKIDIIRKGDVRRAKLYYLRDRKGKSARIVDSNRGEEADQYELVETLATEKVDKKSSEETTEAVTESKSENKQSQNTELSKTEKDNQEVVDSVNNSTEEKSESSTVETENSDNEQKT
tara:strand:+ start:867 stop:1478 length:612 start_codon:yes stop_codon:yes gene_type:complete